MSKLPSPIQMNIYNELSNYISIKFKELLENKHLYQSINIDLEEFVRLVEENELKHFSGQVLELAANLINRNWVDFSVQFKKSNYPDSITFTTLIFGIPDVKLYCKTCERIEAFNAVNSDDFLRDKNKPEQTLVLNSKNVQSFVISYLCQSCKTVPVVFLIRRESTRITLSGRSPIEKIDVPNIIPKEVNSYYSSAVLAFQSGQTLAANFLLRTLIEQWAIKNSKKKINSADEAIDAYMQSLPDDFKNRFPSARDLYSKLSADIHNANGSESVFSKSLNDLIEHFEARKLFKL